MRALLDTHVFLWWVADDPRLSAVARATIEKPGNTILFSAVSGWEIAIKSGLGRLRIPGGPTKFVTSQLADNVFVVLPVHLPHTLKTAELPDHHRDPFDRLLIAQALVENLPIISGDEVVKRYPVSVIW